MNRVAETAHMEFADGDRRPPWLTASLAPVLAIMSCVLYSCNGELLQFLQLHAADGGRASPLLNLVLCHVGGIVFAPHFLFWKPSSFQGGQGLSVHWGSLLLALCIMAYNYAWLLSARFLAVGLTNAIFQTSIALVYLASVFVFRDALLAPAQIIGVGLSLGGSVLASGVLGLGGTVASNWEAGLGIFLALCASVGCMAYQVLFKYFYGHLKGDARFLAHIGAWVSVWHIIAILPLVCLAHITGFEVMEFPHGRAAVVGTLASACVASMVNAMYICIVMWGSSMLLPCASAFSVPCTVGLDMVLHAVVPARLQICGHIMVVLSVVLIMDLHKSSFKRFPMMSTSSEKMIYSKLVQIT